MIAATFLAIFLVPLFFKLIYDRRFKTLDSDFDHPEHHYANDPYNILNSPFKKANKVETENNEVKS
jgi:hypothetical protein